MDRERGRFRAVAAGVLLLGIGGLLALWLMRPEGTTDAAPGASQGAPRSGEAVPTRVGSPPATTLEVPEDAHRGPDRAGFVLQLIDAKLRCRLVNAPVTVRCDAPSGTVTVEGRTDSAGGMHVGSPTDTARLLVTVPGFLPATFERGTERSVTVELRGTGALRVAVTEATTGAGIRSASVLVASTALSAKGGQPRGVSEQTDEEGSARFTELPPGASLNVVARAAGYAPAPPLPLAIDAGETAETHVVTIRLMPVRSMLVHLFGVSEDLARLLALEVNSGNLEVDRTTRGFDWNADEGCAESVATLPFGAGRSPVVRVVGPLGIVLGSREIGPSVEDTITFSVSLNLHELRVVAANGDPWAEGTPVGWQTPVARGSVVLGSGGGIRYLLAAGAGREILRLFTDNATTAELILPVDGTAVMRDLKAARLVVTQSVSLGQTIALWKDTAGVPTLVQSQPSRNGTVEFTVVPGDYRIGSPSQPLSGRIRLGEGGSVSLDGTDLVQSGTLELKRDDADIGAAATAQVFVPQGASVRVIEEDAFQGARARVLGLPGGKYLVLCATRDGRYSWRDVVVRATGTTSVDVPVMRQPVVCTVSVLDAAGAVTSDAFRVRGLPVGLGFGEEISLAANGTRSIRVLPGMAIECPTLRGTTWLVRDPATAPVELGRATTKGVVVQVSGWWKGRVTSLTLIGGTDPVEAVTLTQ